MFANAAKIIEKFVDGIDGYAQGRHDAFADLFIFQQQGHGQIGMPVSLSQQAQQPVGGAMPGTHARDDDVGIQDDVHAQYAPPYSVSFLFVRLARRIAIITSITEITTPITADEAIALSNSLGIISTFSKELTAAMTAATTPRIVATAAKISGTFALSTELSFRLSISSFTMKQ